MERQIYRRSLHAGDIALECHAGSATHWIITAGQALSGAERWIVHAGLIARDRRSIIEAVKPHLRRVQLDSHADYLVYRSRNGALALGAAECAEMLIGANNQVPYYTKGTITSLVGRAGPKSDTDFDSIIDKLFSGGDHALFCSQLVVFVYQFVARQNGIPAEHVFNFADTRANPAFLAKSLAARPGQFEFVGHLVHGQFDKPLPITPPSLVRTTANLDAMKLRPLPGRR